MRTALALLVMVLLTVGFGWLAYTQRVAALEAKREVAALNARLKAEEQRRVVLNRELNAIRQRERVLQDKLASVPVSEDELVVSDVLREAMEGARR